MSDVRLIDAAPVVHAMWEQRGNIILCAGEHGCYEAMPWNYYTQSKFDWKLPAYCPHCGAMMDAKDIDVPTKERDKICPTNGAPCNECVPGAYCAKMDGGAENENP